MNNEQLVKDLKEELIGNEYSVIELSNVLQAKGCEDICDFDNWGELLEDGNVVVATDECGENNIQIYFNVSTLADTTEEVIEGSVIEIVDIIEF